MGRITMEFAVGTDMAEALLMVNTRLQQVPEYPEDADEPVVSTSNLSDRPIAWFILSQRAADDEEFAAFAGEHPELADVARAAPSDRQRRPAHATARGRRPRSTRRSPS